MTVIYVPHVFLDGDREDEAERPLLTVTGDQIQQGILQLAAIIPNFTIIVDL